MKRSMCLKPAGKPVGDTSQTTHAVSSRFKQAKSGRFGINSSVCHGRLRLISATPRIPRLNIILVKNCRGKPSFALKAAEERRPWRKSATASLGNYRLVESC